MKPFDANLSSQRRSILSALGIAAACGISMTGCVQGGAIPDSLTSEQEEAIVAALAALEGVTSASQAAQSAAQSENEDTAKLRRQTRLEFTFGVCPEVTVGRRDGDTPPSLLIDFGAGCSPVWAPDLACSGSMSGSIDLQERELSLGFANLTCGVAVTDGSLSYGWSLSQDEVALTGDSDITITESGEPDFRYDASGALVYTFATTTTTVNTYSGLLSYGNDEWTLDLTETPVSYAIYDNFVPFGGDALLTAPGFGDNTVQVFFDANSPITGIVQVSVNGGPLFDWTIIGF